MLVAPLRSLSRNDALVGRAQDLAALDRRYADGTRLTTLSGPGGVGKTRLASEYALVRAAQFEGGVYVCDASEARSLDALCDAVAATIALPMAGATSHDESVALVGRALEARGRTLLVLDNLEQIIDAAGHAVTAWLGAAPGLCVLATSRERLRLPAESVHELGALGLDGGAASEAVVLFVRRARDAGAPFAVLDAATLATVAQIVRVLDGMPLAIELAAARTNVLGPDEILARLGDRFRLLTRGARGVPDRHATLRASIEWSWNLLASHEREAMMQLAVFRGGFSTEAAERVLDLGAHPGAPAALDVLQSLREKSLLVARPGSSGGSGGSGGGSLRLGMYASFREFAEEQLDAHHESDAAASDARRRRARRHGEHYATTCRPWALVADGPDGAAMLERLTLESENLLSAAERALAESPATASSVGLALRALLAVDPVTGMRTSPHVQRTRLEVALGHAPDDLDPALRAAALYAKAWHEARLARHGQSVEDHNAALALARSIGDPSLESRILCGLATALVTSGEFDLGSASYERSLAIARQCGDQAAEAMAMTFYADLLRFTARAVDAEHRARDALALTRAHCSPRWQVFAQSVLGAACSGQRGRESEAYEYLLGARELATRFGVRFLEGVTLGALGAVAHLQGRLDEAAEHYVLAGRVARELGASRIHAFYVGSLGLVRWDQGRHDEGRAGVEQSRAALIAIGDQHSTASITADLVVLEADAGHTQRAQELLQTLASGPTQGLAAELIAIARACVQLALGRDAVARGDRAAASEQRAAARRTVEAVVSRSAAAPTPTNLRLALRAYERAAALGDEGPPAAPVTVQRQGAWFRVPGGRAVDCRNRQAVRLVLAALTAQRERLPGEPLSAQALIAAGWPNEKIMALAARNRLKTSIALLRKIGLGDVLVTHPSGYLLDPAVPIDVVEAYEPAP